MNNVVMTCFVTSGRDGSRTHLLWLPNLYALFYSLCLFCIKKNNDKASSKHFKTTLNGPFWPFIVDCNMSQNLFVARSFLRMPSKKRTF